jgi:uncharacterized protein YukE
MKKLLINFSFPEQTVENTHLKGFVQDLESKITTMQQSFKGEREREGDI